MKHTITSLLNNVVSTVVIVASTALIAASAQAAGKSTPPGRECAVAGCNHRAQDQAASNSLTKGKHDGVTRGSQHHNTRRLNRERERHYRRLRNKIM